MVNAMVDLVKIDSTNVDVRRKEGAPASVVATLYDLVAAIQDVVDADDTLVVTTVRHLLDSGRAIWHGAAAPCLS